MQVVILDFVLNMILVNHVIVLFYEAQQKLNRQTKSHVKINLMIWVNMNQK